MDETRYMSGSRALTIRQPIFRPYQLAEFRQAQALSKARLITNQVEYHPYLSQKTLIETARDLGSSITAWSPLAQGKIADDAVIGEIATAHGKTPGQVTLRWLIQQDVIAIPRTRKAERAAWDFAARTPGMNRTLARIPAASSAARTASA